MDDEAVGGTGTRSLLERLEHAKHRFDPAARMEKVRALRALGDRPIMDPSLLLRFHEALCFLQAYPDDRAVLDLVDRALAGFTARVHGAAAGGPRGRRRLEDSGIAGTMIHYPFGYPMARWLARSFPGAAEIDWGTFRGTERLRDVLSLLVSAPEQDALDDERVPIREWIRGAKRGQVQTDLAWLVELFDLSALRHATKDHLFESLDLPVRWRVDGAASRTFARLPVSAIACQHLPLRRRAGAFRRMIREPLAALRPPARPERERLIHVARCALAVRHRELYGLEHPNARDVFVAEVGRGVQVVLIGVAPEFRLPLEGVYSFLVLKNGVPVAYGAGTVVFERLEIAVNVFESFRQGESAWLFAQVLRAFNRHVGVTAFLVDRYQIGHANPEAIASGAFWFFYKLGFRPADPDLRRLARAESRRIAERSGYRSTRQTLLRLSRGDMWLDLRREGNRAVQAFRAGAIGALVTRCLAAARGSRAGAGRALVARVARDLGATRRRAWPRPERRAFERLAPILAPIPDLHRWPAGQRRGLVRLLRARGRDSEAEYLRRLRGHRRLAWALFRLAGGADGSSTVGCPGRA